MEKRNLNSFISGIYNYCDRWCEKCSFSHRCLVFVKEQERMVKHRKKGEDPYDWKIVAKDMEEDFKEALGLIKKAAAERGINLDELCDVKYVPPDPHDHPLFKSTERYRHLANKFLNRLKDIIQKEEIRFMKIVEMIPSPEEKTFRKIKSCYETVLWYHTLISAKIYRALCREVSTDEDEQLSEIKQSDSDGSAKVAYLGLNNSINALVKIYQWDEELQDEVFTLLIEADKLRKSIDKVFPGHKEFKRPGFDD